MIEMVTEICPLCAHSDLLLVFHRTRVMVSCNFLYTSADAARQAPAGELRIQLCRRCGFVFNGAFDWALVPYGPNYENDQSNSARFHAHMQEMAGRVRAAAGDAPLRAVEIGCGQGQFLRLLLGDPPAANEHGAGFDPSYAGGGAPGCEFHRTLFGPGSLDALDFQPNVVLSRHVIEHIPTPKEFLAHLRAALERLPQIPIFFETPCIDWIFRNHAYWDLCYEHCSYYNAGTLAHAFAAAGFEVRSVDAVFGGQYLWMEATPGPTHRQPPPADETLAARFRQTVAEDRRRWREKLSALRSQARIAVWGAATKGAMFVHDVDPEGALVHCLIDINPLKQNRYLPITAHPVVNWEHALAEGVSVIVVTNPNYLAEIKTMLGKRASGIEFLQL